MRYLTLLVAVFIPLFNGGQGNNLIRKTREGLIRGALAHSQINSSVEYYAFKGIPYAQPPVGNLRFKEPLPLDPWSGLRDATKSGNMCVQISDHYMGDDVVGNEDCLYLEIYEPKSAKLEDRGLLPVLVWIHGGAFIFGSLVMDGPDFFMEQPVVLVFVDYRIHVFGFLSTNDEFATGNFGLKDQACALKWIQENIKNFGGDPNRVTIFGSSAGGASVQYQMLSEKSKGLFQRGISQSGSTLNRWALQEKPLEMTRRLAKGLGIDKTNTKDIVNELKKIDYQVLMKAVVNQTIVGFYIPYNGYPFVPSIESESKTSFFTESTFKLLKKGKITNKVPLIMGYNTEEGSYGYNSINNGKVDMNIYQENPGLIIPISMNVSKGSQCYNESLNRIKAFYFKNGPITDKKNWIPYMSQDLFLRGIIKSTELMRELIPLYLYKFTFLGSKPLSYLGGTGHHEEVPYMLLNLEPNQTWCMDDLDKLTSRRLLKLWVNFAATGNPTPKKDELLQEVIWPKVGEKRAFLDIGGDLTVLENLNQEHYEFWEKMFADCGTPPYNTY